jgi:hypothetical protein
MRRYSQALLAVFIGALAACLTMAAVGATVATIGRSESDLSTIVNRARKGDRLPLIPASNLRGNSKLPVGCESVASSIVPSQLVHVVGRCLT